MTFKLVTTGEVRRMRALRAEGLSNAAIAAAMGRAEQTIRNHAGSVPRGVPAYLATRIRGAQRVERFFAACNRAIAEARA